MSVGRFLRVLTLAAVVAALCALPASAGSGAAFDSTQAQTAAPVSLPSILATVPFLLGEVDLATLGAASVDFTTAGTSSAQRGEHDDDDSPDELVVDDDRAQCPDAPYTSIQAAVVDAGPGDRIKVCPGTYQEQVRIPAGKDGLTLYSKVPWQAVIKAPPVMTLPNSIVLVDGSHNVTIRLFTITGPFTHPGCALSVERHTGVRITGGGSSLIYGNRITQIRDITPGFFGCQDGIAVLVGRSVEGQTGTAWIRNNLIDKYQKGGIVVDGSGSYAEIEKNVVTGEGLTDITAQNGVQISRGAKADVEHNRISKNRYARLTDPNTTAAGVLLFETTSSSVEIDENDVYENGAGIDLATTRYARVSHNNVHDNLNDGLVAESDTYHNRFEGNRAFRNAPDCADYSAGDGTAGTANYWIHNSGKTENRHGLCKDRGRDDD
jgi:parallel beta-helix repeat protein